MKFFIVLLALIFSVMPAQALTRVYVEGNINYNGEYTKPEILLADSGSKDTYDAVPDLTLSDLIVNIGGFKENSDIENVIFVRDNSSEYIDFTDKKKQKMVLKDGDKVIVGEIDDYYPSEATYIDFIRNKYYQNTVLLCVDRSKHNEVISYKDKLLGEILVNLPDNEDYNYKIFVKRLNGDKLKKIKVKSPADFRILPDDIIYITD